MAHELPENEEEPCLGIDCPVLVTERLVLRRPHESDAIDLTRLANNIRIATMLTRMPHPYGMTEAEAFIRNAERRQQGCIYAITLADNGQFLGCAGFDQVGPDKLEIGYWFGQPFWGMGYATEAAHALIDVAFRNTNAAILLASCRVNNHASRRVIHKCGFQPAGHGMKSSVAAGQINVENYALDRATWIGLRSWQGPS